MIDCTFASTIGKDFCFDKWVENTANIYVPKEKMKLLWLVNQNVDYEKVKKAFDIFSNGFAEKEIIVSPFRFYSHQVEATTPEGFVKKRWGVAFNMNIINQRRKGDLFVIEDDIFPPHNAFLKLSTLARLEDVGAASGVACSFKTTKPLYTAWIFLKQRILPNEVINDLQEIVPNFDFFDYEILRLPKGDGVDEVHANGTVCTYIREECIKDYVFVGESNLFTGQDVNLGWHITHKLKKRYLVDWDIECQHWEFDEQDNLKIRGGKK